MKFSNHIRLWRFKWHFLIGGIAVILLLILTSLSRPSEAGPIARFIWLLIPLGLLAAVVLMLVRVVKGLTKLAEYGAKLEEIADALEKTHTELVHIKQNTRLSETAKAIASREADRQSLREAVFDKLQQKDFESAYEIIDEIGHATTYAELAKLLLAEADRYRDATDAERVNQVIAQIENLFGSFQWAKAGATIERLIKAYPNSEEAKTMRQKLLDKKQEHKKVLLNAWDDAVKRQATDRSIEILKELDLYLTANEGLALQEAARDVFRNKLHNLGVQFSLAVSESRWGKAVEIGDEIMRDFPNSRMAEEIREKTDTLRQNAQQQTES